MNYNCWKVSIENDSIHVKIPEFDLEQWGTAYVQKISQQFYEHVKEAAQHLPGIYTRLIGSDIERRVETNPYPLSEKVASAEQRTLAASCRGSHSLDKEAVADRCMLSSIRNESIPTTTLTDVNRVSEDAEKLAMDYAIYKLAALSRIASFDSEFPLTARLCVSQNHT